MLGKILGLPRRLSGRIRNLMDGERSAPAHVPAVETLVNPDLPKATDPLPPSGVSAAAKKTAKPKAKAKKTAPPPPPPGVQVIPEPTPNPNAMKFSVGKTVCTTGSFSFAVGESPVAHPIAQAVLQIEGVKTVFGVSDFVTVTKSDTATWDALVPHLVSAIGGALAEVD
jgi:hypothetical protein